MADETGMAEGAVVSQQRKYYARTAAHYDDMHIREDDEHGIALSAFSGMALLREARSILDVGAGTGRALMQLRRRLPDARLVGVEPVRELREMGHRQGIPDDMLIDGDALNLCFADDAFDFVVETGVLHHIATPSRAVSEMVRVARHGVMISDANVFGQGSRVARAAKGLLRSLRIWDLTIRLQTGGKMSKWSEGDGVYFSYSVFSDIEIVRHKFPRIFVMNTTPLDGTDARAGAAQAMIIGLK